MTGPVVIKVGGTTLEDPRTSPQLWDAIAALARTRAVIVVHGGGRAVDRLLEKLGMPVERKNGLRVTPEDQIEYIAGVLAGSINKRIVAALSTRRVRAVGICLGDGGAVPTIRKRVSDPAFDLGLVGEPLPGEIDASLYKLLPLLCATEFVPVVSSIGIDVATGALLNVNADDAAVGVAFHASADTLVLMTDVPGILDQHRQLIPSIDERGIERLISEGVVTGGMIPKARAAVSAAAALGAPVVILSGNDPDSLARWAAGSPAGTTIVPPTARERS